MTDEMLLKLWAKTVEDDDKAYHPLLFHMLDVAHVALALWDHVLSERIKVRIAHALGLEPDQARLAVALLAGLHDLGKASAFQLKAPALWPQVAAIGDNPTLAGNTHAHALMTFALLHETVSGEAGGWIASPRAAKLMGQILGGHHGQFPPSCEIVRREPGIAARGGAAWDEMRRALTVRCTELLLEGRQPPRLGAPPPCDAALAPLLGGIVCAADWIGSNQDYFPASPHADPCQYASEGRERAARALADLGWTPVPAYATPAPFGEVFRDESGRPFTPNAVQRAGIEVAEGAKAPYLLIVEAAMGDGKTELALFAADRALGCGLAHGLFVGVPTMATGDAMFSRIWHDYLDRRGHGERLNYHLAHGGSLLNQEYERLRIASADEDNPKADGRVIAESWFVPKKQCLLAPLGVGTIDQSLLGTLQTNHWFVRLFGLAGKVVVFDEVHAYDTYMSGILQRLLGWLRALDCTVILLSATLPPSRREELLRAWRVEAMPAPASYPRLTCADSSGARSVGVRDDKPPKPVAMVWQSADFRVLAHRICAEMPQGGCGVVICNTVARVQEACRTLREVLRPKGWLVLAIHARMPARWRKRRESRVLRWLGRGGRRPVRLIVVGSQVLEQSLDYDADWMATEMAPIDLLLQRMGRLWRHPRPARPVPEARFTILCDADDAGLPRFPPGTAREHARGVYEPYWLLRSWLALRPARLKAEGLLDDSGRLLLPAAIDPLVSAAYDDPEPSNLEASLKEVLSEAHEQCNRGQDEERRCADRVVVPDPSTGLDGVLEPGATLDSHRRNLWDDDDPTVHPTVRAATRLGDPTVNVVCAGTAAGGLSLAGPVSADPSLAEAKQALAFALGISNKGLFDALVKLEPPRQWRQNRHLRFHRRLEFVNGECRQIPGFVLRLTHAEGLVIDREAPE